MAPRSEVVVEDGWTWLQPVAASTRVRHALGTFVLAVLVLVGGATATLLPPPSAVAATALVATVAVGVLVAIVRSAGSRLALSDLGLYMQNGGSAHQLGWAAVRDVSARPARGRLRLVIDDGYRPRVTAATFEEQAVRRWLELVAAEAARRQLHPQPHPDGPGFTTTT